MVKKGVILILLFCTVLACTKEKCGDGTCNSGESCTSCMEDCACKSGYDCVAGQCIIKCGNTICDATESCSSCPADCKCNGVCMHDRCEPCGDKLCSDIENCWSCPMDCKCQDGEFCNPEGCKRSVCGNGLCEFDEDQLNCCNDCGCVLTGTTCNADKRSCEYPKSALTAEEAEKIARQYIGEGYGETVRIIPFVSDGPAWQITVEQDGMRRMLIVEDSGETYEMPIM